MKYKVAIIAPVHIWDDVRIFKKQAISLSESGFDVAVIARAASEFDSEDIRIIPAKVSYATRTQRFTSIPRVALQALRYKADIYHLHNPDTIPIAIFLKLFGKKVIYDTHEDFSQRILAKDWIPVSLRGIVAKLVDKMEMFTAKVCDASIATQADVVARFGEKCLLVGNAPRVNQELISLVEDKSEEIRVDENGVFRLVYIGSINESRGIYEMVDSLVFINHQFKCRLWLIGSINDSLLSELSFREGWSFVDYIPTLPQEEALAYVSISDVGLVYINDVADHHKSDANKTYEYMTFGKPFIASDFKLWVDKLEFLNAGVFVRPGDAFKLSDAVCQIYHMTDQDKINMGNRGKCYVKNNSWEQSFTKLLELYKTILAKN